MTGKTRNFHAVCGCGYSRRATAAEIRTPPRCPGCGKVMTVQNAPPRPKTKIRKAMNPKTRVRARTEAPLHTTVKAGAKFFDCVCGERVLFLELTDRPIQCPGCERFHRVEMAAPPPPPPPKPAPVAAPAAGPSRSLGPGEFLCQCGAVQPPRTSRTGRDFTCKSCGRKGYVEVDPGMKMRPVFTSGPGAAAATPEPESTVAHAGDPAWTCPCGQKINANTVLTKKEASCPRCGRSIALEKHHPQKSVTMIRPRFLERPPEDPLADLDKGNHQAACECGAMVEVSVSLVGLAVQCPACEGLMKVEWESGRLTLRAMTEL